MKAATWIKLVLINLFVVFMIISPFIPGPANSIVKWTSVFGQIAGTFGLLFVPIGLAWLIIEKRKPGNANESATYHRWRYNFAVATVLFIILIFLAGIVFVPNPMPKITFLSGLVLVLTAFVLALQQKRKWKNNNYSLPDHGALIILSALAIACVTFVYLFAVLFVFVGIGIIPGILALLLLPAGLYAAIRRVSKLKDAGPQKIIPLPFYFMTIPVAAFLTFMFLVRPASDFSRSFAIKKSEALIALIEDYRNKTGEYPAAVNDLVPHPGKKMPMPFIMGIEKFRYNKINDRYSISFSQWLDLGSLEEIVLYDKNNLRNNLPGEFSKYDYSFDLSRIKGAFASYETVYEHWKYYHVD
ncbi:MAG: hypothetical protein SFU87_06800 [Chitinophagaceae bacterium]|nr:hypothetical protein [Chitinophagaceae bacterium]